MAEVKDTVWQSPEIVEKYLQGVRAAIPLAAEQIDVMLRLIVAREANVERFLDLGCGDGVLAQTILDSYPAAAGVLLDFSEAMIAAAAERLARYRTQLRFAVEDYSDPSWLKAVAAAAPLDVVVSGFSIHHQPDSRKRELYAEIHGLLKPGGLFVNIEHVSSPTRWVEVRFEDLFIDNLCALHSRGENALSREEVACQYYNREDKAANILAPVEQQCDWLREIGFTDVDCYLKVFELAVFGGRRAAE